MLSTTRDGYIEEEIQLMRMADENAALAWCAEHFGADGRGFFEAPFEFPQPDMALLGDEMFQKVLAEAFRQGGYAHDVYVQGRPWPFDPNRITAPIEVVHGEADTLLPMAHSRHTAELIPGSSFRTYPGHGHLTMLSELPMIASALTAS